MTRAVYIHEFSALCALGSDTASVRTNLLLPTPPRLHDPAILNDGRVVPTGRSGVDLTGGDTRCNILADRLVAELEAEIALKIEKFGASRVAVIVGTCTSGVEEGAQAFDEHRRHGNWPRNFQLAPQELGMPATHVAARIGAQGPVFGISTACTSGAKALASASRLIRAGLCDVALAGGVDVLTALTLNGFAALESLSSTVCNPFSCNRSGINLGEGGALFLLSAEPSAIRLSGFGETADAYHISAPDPEGKGAIAAMQRALQSASCSPEDVGYLNLHGTATKLNDLMEARAVTDVFGSDLLCSSTKPMTGHMLGAAGACEAAFAIMALQEKRLPTHFWDGEADPAMPQLRLVEGGNEAKDLRRAMSCSYAFGGNNIALLMEAE